MSKLSPDNKEYLSVSQAAPESVMKRLRLLAQDACVIGTQQAYLRVGGHIDDPQLTALNNFCALYERYLKAIDSKGIKTSSGEAHSPGTPPDPDSLVGMERTKDDRDTIAEYQSARLVAMSCGKDAYVPFLRVIIAREAPVGYADHRAIQTVARALVAHRQLSSRHRRARGRRS